MVLRIKFTRKNKNIIREEDFKARPTPSNNSSPFFKIPKTFNSRIPRSNLSDRSEYKNENSGLMLITTREVSSIKERIEREKSNLLTPLEI